jgi:hypothetical protein
MLCSVSISLFPLFEDQAQMLVVVHHQGIEHQIGEELIAGPQHVHLVGIGQTLLDPKLDRTQAAHHRPSIPDHGIVPLCQSEHGIAHQGGILVRVLLFVVAVGIGGEQDGGPWIGQAHPGRQGIVVQLKRAHIKLGGIGIVDADGKHHKVGLKRAQMRGEELATAVGARACAIHPDGMIDKTWVRILQAQPIQAEVGLEGIGFPDFQLQGLGESPHVKFGAGQGRELARRYGLPIHQDLQLVTAAVQVVEDADAVEIIVWALGIPEGKPDRAQGIRGRDHIATQAQGACAVGLDVFAGFPLARVLGHIAVRPVGARHAVGEDETPPPPAPVEGRLETLPQSVRPHVGLHMRAPDVDHVYLPLAKAQEAVHLAYKGAKASADPGNCSTFAAKFTNG